MSSISLQTCMRDFNRQAQLHQKCRTEKGENMLGRTLSLISSLQYGNEFNPESVESCQFYVNLHRLVSGLNSDSIVTWASVAVLQQAIRNVEARQAIVDQFKFVPVLAGLLRRVSSEDKLTRLLTLLQELTYGIRITWHEPYLTDFIQNLVDLIYTEEEKETGRLALSVLTNVSYKNMASIYLIMRSVHASTFTKKIKPYGILASKMRLILDNNIDLPNVCELHYFIKNCFMEIEECLRNCSVPNMRHIVDFLTDAKNYKGMFIAMTDYQNFRYDIETLLKNIDSKMDTDDISSNSNDLNKNQPICYALLLELIDFIMGFDDTLIPIIGLIFNFALKWLESDYASPKAIACIRTIIKKSCSDTIAEIINKIEKFIPQLVSVSEKDQSSNGQTIALLKLLIVLLQHPESQRMVFSMVTESYYDNMFMPLISTNPETLNCSKVTNDEIAKYLLCLLTLSEFSRIAPGAWCEKLRDLFQKKQIHFVIAKGLLSNSEDLCCVVFDLAKLNDFPKAEVVKIIGKLSPMITGKCIPTDARVFFPQKTPYSELYFNTHISTCKSLEDRLDTLMNHIFEAINNSEINNVATSELIELFEYKTNMCANREKDLGSRLESASSEITNLSHLVSLLSSEMSKYQNMNFKLHLTQERLQAEYTDVQKQRDTLKDSLSELVKKIDNERAKYQAYAKSLDLKIAEINVLQQELDKYKKRDAINVAELNKLEAAYEEASVRIERFKKHVKIYEDNGKEKQRLLDEKEKENIKALKAIDDYKEKNFRMENLIKHLEEQVTEKNDAIKAYETELKETEEMRKTILSLMQNKKSTLKRDN